MAWIDPRYEAERRKYWTRPDAYRFAPPGSPEAKMPGWLDPWMTRVRFKEAHEDEARAQAAAEQEALEREIAELRRDWEELKREIAARDAATRLVAEVARIKSDIAWDRFLSTFKRYAEQQKAGFNPDQPRDEFGKWTDSGRDAGKEGSDDRARSTDITAQRRIGSRPAGTPAQHARLDVAAARARDAVARVQQIQPNWRPESATSFDNRSNIEVMIRAKEAETREAEARFIALSRAGHDDAYPRRDARMTDEFLVPGGERIGSRTPGADEHVRTVTPGRFEELRIELMGGARRIDSDPEYNGVWYRRQDGSEFGLRISRHGLTIDVLRSDHPLLRDGFRIHQR